MKKFIQNQYLVWPPLFSIITCSLDNIVFTRFMQILKWVSILTVYIFQICLLDGCSTLHYNKFHKFSIGFKLGDMLETVFPQNVFTKIPKHFSLHSLPITTPNLLDTPNNQTSNKGLAIMQLLSLTGDEYVSHKLLLTYN